MKILVLNSGSSSQKSALFDVGPDSSDDPVQPLWEGKLDWRDEQERVHIRNFSNKEISAERQAGDRQAAVEAILRNLWTGPTAVLNHPDEVAIVGHRIVHGGANL